MIECVNCGVQLNDENTSSVDSEYCADCMPDEEIGDDVKKALNVGNGDDFDMDDLDDYDDYDNGWEDED